MFDVDVIEVIIESVAMFCSSLLVACSRKRFTDCISSGEIPCTTIGGHCYDYDVSVLYDAYNMVTIYQR